MKIAPHIAIAASILWVLDGWAASLHEPCSTTGSSAAVSVTPALLNGRSMWHVQSSGCYPWDPPKQQSTPNTPSVSPHDVYVPQVPVISDNPFMIGRTDLAVMGTIGITFSGVAVYGDGDAERRPAYQYEGPSMDSCNGHADMSGTYHVHTMTGGCCSYPAQNGTAHSPFWAVMADGIPVAGPLGDNGTVPTDLDECRGHTDATYGFYHYHVTSTISQDPYIVGCLKGCVFHNFGNRQLDQLVNADCTPASMQYDYSSLNMTWSAAQVSASTIEACPYTYSAN